MKTVENEESVRRYVERGGNGGQPDHIDEPYGDDCVGHWFLPGGREATRADLCGFIAAFQEFVRPPETAQ